MGSNIEGRVARGLQNEILTIDLGAQILAVQIYPLLNDKALALFL
jgi:hypothetical protein